jgi:hypothetical protein
MMILWLLKMQTRHETAYDSKLDSVPLEKLVARGVVKYCVLQEEGCTRILARLSATGKLYFSLNVMSMS